MYSWPKSDGHISCVHLGSPAACIGIGFSMHVGQPNCVNNIKKLRASSIRAARPGSLCIHREPTRLKYVHGGCAITISQPHVWLRRLRTSVLKCHSGCPPVQSSMSHDHADAPAARKAFVTTWEYSQATNTFFISLKICVRSNIFVRLIHSQYIVAAIIAGGIERVMAYLRCPCAVPIAHHAAKVRI